MGRYQHIPESEKPPIRGCRDVHACARLVRQAATREYRRANSSWARKEGLVRMLHGDVRDMREVARRLGRGDRSGALDKTHEMDTDAREKIPLAVYCFLDPKSIIRGCR